jgi:hypothetical protein
MNGKIKDGKGNKGWERKEMRFFFTFVLFGEYSHGT